MSGFLLSALAMYLYVSTSSQGVALVIISVPRVEENPSRLTSSSSVANDCV